MKSFKKWFLIMLLLQIVILDVPTDSLRTTIKKGSYFDSLFLN